MTDTHLTVGVERAARKTFVWAIDWPGWCRPGKDLEREPPPSRADA